MRSMRVITVFLSVGEAFALQAGELIRRRSAGSLRFHKGFSTAPPARPATSASGSCDDLSGSETMMLYWSLVLVVALISTRIRFGALSATAAGSRVVVFPAFPVSPSQAEEADAQLDLAGTGARPSRIWRNRNAKWSSSGGAGELAGKVERQLDDSSVLNACSGGRARARRSRGAGRRGRVSASGSVEEIAGG
jgi:uncharacterized membrane protein YtjA (UPF0391 family)